jgi:hypothetical protein
MPYCGATSSILCISLYGVSTDGGNVIAGAGSNLGGWSFTVDMDKPPEQGLNGTRALEPIRFGSGELYAAINRAIQSLGLEHLKISDFWFVNGAEIREDPNILPDIYSRPRQKLDDRTAAGYTKASDSRIRH